MLIVMLAWSVLTLVYGYVTVQEKLALLARSPSPKLVENWASFQVLLFVMAKVPALVALLLVVLGFQLLFLHAQPPTLSAGDLRYLRHSLLVGILLITVALLWYMLTANIKYDPWLHYDEQLILTFFLSRLPVYALLLGFVLGGQIWWLRSRAS